MDDPTLFGPADVPRAPAGPVRRGLEQSIVSAGAGGELPAAGVAALRTLADQIDRTERLLQSPRSKPYDGMPLVSLLREFRESFAQTFAVVHTAEDPLMRALAEFNAADGGTAAHDTAGSKPAD